MSNKPISHDDLMAQFHLLRSDPAKYLELANQLVQHDPSDGHAYFSRHQAWAHLNRYDLALADLNKSLSLEPHYVTHRARGKILRDMGRYREAIDAFNRCQEMDPIAWVNALGPLLRADCHARLGNEEAALADCASLRDEHWTPGIFGTPAGNKAEVAAELRRIAAAARARNR
jgi:tetratricopeptide (TPR) repeat protein